MAEERQQSQSTQSQGQPQGQPPSGQDTQESPRRSNGQQTSLARRRSFMPSVFTMAPGEMFRTSPFALIRRLSEEMDQWVEQFGMSHGGRGSAMAGGSIHALPVEVFEREGTLVVRADLPGLSKDDVRVEVTDEALVIEGERRAEHEEQQGGMFHSERHYGRFRRQIPLPEGVNADQATASFKDGVLEVAMPAPQRQTRGRRIDIQGGTASDAGAHASHGAAAPLPEPTAGRTDARMPESAAVTS
jgi:HSP20 family protein